MVIPAVALKILAGAVVCGSLATSIAVPTVMSKNSSSWPVLNSFPRGHKEKFQEKCQLLTMGVAGSVDKKGFLFVCIGEDGYPPNFYFYTERDNPLLIRELKEETKRDEGIELIVTMLTDTGTEEGKITAPIGSWTDVIDKELSECGIKENENHKNKRWTLLCPKGDSAENRDILLTPVIIK